MYIYKLKIDNLTLLCDKSTVYIPNLKLLAEAIKKAMKNRNCVRVTVHKQLFATRINRLHLLNRMGVVKSDLFFEVNRRE